MPSPSSLVTSGERQLNAHRASSMIYTTIIDYPFRMKVSEYALLLRSIFILWSHPMLLIHVSWQWSSPDRIVQHHFLRLGKKLTTSAVVNPLPHICSSPDQHLTSSFFNNSINPLRSKLGISTVVAFLSVSRCRWPRQPVVWIGQVHACVALDMAISHNVTGYEPVWLRSTSIWEFCSIVHQSTEWVWFEIFRHPICMI